MGGVQLLVPADWKVQVDVKPVMGGVQDARTRGADPDRPVDLVLTGRVMLGGLEVASKAPRPRRPEREAPAASEAEE
jgi:hypothetical protein